MNDLFLKLCLILESPFLHYLRARKVGRKNLNEEGKNETILALGLVFGLLTPAVAQQSAGKTAIELMGSATKLVAGNHDDALISPWFGLALTHSFTKKLGLELSDATGWSRPRDASKNGITSYVTLRPGTPYRTFLYPLKANLRLNLRPDSHFNPYLTAGGGALFWDLQDVSTENKLFL